MWSASRSFSSLGNQDIFRSTVTSKKKVAHISTFPAQIQSIPSVSILLKSATFVGLLECLTGRWPEVLLKRISLCHPLEDLFWHDAFTCGICIRRAQIDKGLNNHLFIRRQVFGGRTLGLWMRWNVCTRRNHRSRRRRERRTREGSIVRRRGLWGSETSWRWRRDA